MNKMKIVLKSAGLFLTALLLLCGCQIKQKEEMVSKEGFFFDTIINISVASEDAEELLEHCFTMCQDYEDTFSRTKENSELYRVNHRTDQEVTVSEDFYTLLQAASYYYELTEGKFDTTIAPLLDEWDFKSDDPKLPEKERIEQSLHKVGYSQVELYDNQKVKFMSPDVMLDFGALAKGYIADRLKEYLISQGVERGIINLGGNVLTIGEKEDKTPWRVGIQKPFGEEKESLAFVNTSDRSVVSSGIYERYFELEGTLYYHVLDSKTGYPAETDLAQATILSKDSLTGDGLSTSCLLLGSKKAQALIRSLENVEAVFVLKTGEIITTEGAEIQKLEKE